MNRLRRLWEVFDDRTGTSKLFGPVIAHPVPDAKGWVGWSYALGSAVLFSFVLQVVTGIALASAYIPSTGDAYESLAAAFLYLHPAVRAESHLNTMLRRAVHPGRLSQ